MKSKKRELSEEIARLTCKYKKLDSIGCIYLVPYITNNKMKNYDLVLVVSSGADEIQKEIIKYNYLNRKDERIDKFGGHLNILIDSPEFYVVKAYDKADRGRTRALRSGKILFDRTGHYTRVADNDCVSKYKNSFNFRISKRLLNKKDI